MPKNDTALIRSTDIGQAIGLLTRLPAPTAGQDRGSAAAWAYPLAGLFVATLAGMGAILAQRLGMSDALAALISSVSGLSLYSQPT